jgi:hypothetical protein
VWGVACGGKTTDEAGTGDGAGSCVQLDGTRRDDGTVIDCTCDTGAKGTATCHGGQWSACGCDGSSQAGTGGSAQPPATCGNGVVEYGELCDQMDLQGETCASVTMYSLSTGTLRCTPDCRFDTSACLSGAGGSGVGGTLGMMGMGGTLGTGARTSTGGTAGRPIVDSSVPDDSGTQPIDGASITSSDASLD